MDGWTFGETQSIHSSHSFLSQTNNKQSLTTHLMDAREENPHTELAFYPSQAFTSIISRRCVEHKLREAWPRRDELSINDYNDIINDIMDQICDAKSSARSHRRKVRGLRRIFAILVLLDRVGDISHFLEAGINDSNLPLVKTKRPGAKTLYDLCRRGECGRPIDFMSEWDPLVVERFYDLQWPMLSPCFVPRKAHKKVWHYTLESNVVLPYIQMEGSPEKYFGGSAQVFRVRIHENHHDFRESKVSKPPLQLQ